MNRKENIKRAPELCLAQFGNKEQLCSGIWFCVSKIYKRSTMRRGWRKGGGKEKAVIFA